MKKFFLLTLFTPLLTLAQMTELEVRQFVKKASEPELLIMSSQMMQQNYLYHAEIVVDKLLTLNSTSSNYNYRKGYLLIKAKTDYKTALPHLQIAVQSVQKNYDMYSPKEKSAPVDAYYHLAKAYHLDEKLDSAIANYKKFMDNSANQSETIRLAELGITQCNAAKREMSAPKTAVVKNLGNKVNSNVPEYSPVISLDGTSLYFTSRREWEDGSTIDLNDPVDNFYPEDIYVSYLDFDGEWTSPEKLSFCSPSYNEATIGVSSDERRIYVYQDYTGGGDIYFSDFKRNKFDSLMQLDYNEVNTKYWETHCTMTPDGEVMYFASDRPGGFGGRDLYRIIRLPNGEWSKAMNLGPKINTEWDEDAPYVSINDKTLYFSSNGPKSIGGFDIFVTFRDEENQWSEAVNLGYPINSTGDDIFYTTTIDGLKGYLTSFRKDGYGEKDIYEIENDYLGIRPINSLRGTIYSINGAPLPENLFIKVICLNCEMENDRFISPRIKQDSYFAVLKHCKEYEVKLFEETTELRSQRFMTGCSEDNEELIKDFYYGKYTLAGTVSDAASLALLANSKVEFINAETGEVFESFETDETGRFVSNYLDNKYHGDRIRFDVRVSKKTYIAQSFKVDTVLGMAPHLQLDYLITKMDIGIDIGAVININPIYFDLDKSNIRPDAAIELDKIVKIMNENPSMVIELGSHTDCRASKAYNLALSGRRAKSSADYIKKRITNPNRIYGKGYGESKLVNNCECEGTVVSDCSEDEHQANRRTEFRIVKK